MIKNAKLALFLQGVRADFVPRAPSPQKSHEINDFIAAAPAAILFVHGDIRGADWSQVWLADVLFATARSTRPADQRSPLELASASTHRSSSA
jgi:hypothetical protein